METIHINKQQWEIMYEKLTTISNEVRTKVSDFFDEEMCELILRKNNLDSEKHYNDFYYFIKFVKFNELYNEYSLKSFRNNLHFLSKKNWELYNQIVLNY